MSKPRVGQILDSDFKPTRDAIHVPIIPVRAAWALLPGEPITVVPDGEEFIAGPRGPGNDKSPLYIVDPFLPRLVQKDELFYAWILPGVITELWHEWTLKSLDGPRLKTKEKTNEPNLKTPHLNTQTLNPQPRSEKR